MTTKSGKEEEVEELKPDSQKVVPKDVSPSKEGHSIGINLDLGGRGLSDIVRDVRKVWRENSESGIFKRRKIINDFLGKNPKRLSHKKSVDGLYCRWMYLALERVIEKEFEISFIKNYSIDSFGAHEIIPYTVNVDIGVGQRESVLAEGVRFVTEKKTGERWVISAQPHQYESGVEFTVEANDEECAAKFWKRLDYWISNDSPMKGAALKSNGGFLKVDESVTLDDVILPTNTREQLRRSTINFIKSMPALACSGFSQSSGVLLAGPPGTGKTHSCRGIINERGEATAIYVTADAINLPGDLAETFFIARQFAPSIIVIEDIDTLGGLDRKEVRGHPLLGELLNALSGAEVNAGANGGVVTVATTNHLGELDEALRARPGRFDAIVPIEAPDKNGRRVLLQRLFKSLTENNADDADSNNIEVNISVVKLADRCSGFTGSHLEALVKGTVVEATHRQLESSRKNGRGKSKRSTGVNLVLTDEDALNALERVNHHIEQGNVEGRNSHETGKSRACEAIYN